MQEACRRRAGGLPVDFLKMWQVSDGGGCKQAKSRPVATCARKARALRTKLSQAPHLWRLRRAFACSLLRVSSWVKVSPTGFSRKVFLFGHRFLLDSLLRVCDFERFLPDSLLRIFGLGIHSSGFWSGVFYCLRLGYSLLRVPVFGLSFLLDSLFRVLQTWTGYYC